MVLVADIAAVLVFVACSSLLGNIPAVSGTVVVGDIDYNPAEYTEIAEVCSCKSGSLCSHLDLVEEIANPVAD